MNLFAFSRPFTVPDALHDIGQIGAKFLAGGTNLVDLMKYDVERPARIIDVGHLPELQKVAPTSDGGLRVGALVTNSAVADHPAVRRSYPLLARAILSGATPQLRNAATTGGNLLQRTRCGYFNDAAVPCNKRQPGSGCPAIAGINRSHAILGASEHCIATHPSDMCVALAALSAIIVVAGPRGERRIPFADFHRLPGDDPSRDTTLARDELILAVELPPVGFAEHFTYLKLRDRHSYAFALVSVAAGLELAEGRIVRAALALGGVAHKPWRVPAAEAALLGQEPGEEAFAAAAAALLAGAQGHSHNAFKIELARRATLQRWAQAAAGTPQPVADKRIV